MLLDLFKSGDTIIIADVPHEYDQWLLPYAGLTGVVSSKDSGLLEVLLNPHPRPLEFKNVYMHSETAIRLHKLQA